MVSGDRHSVSLISRPGFKILRVARARYVNYVLFCVRSPSSLPHVKLCNYFMLRKYEYGRTSVMFLLDSLCYYVCRVLFLL